MVHFLFCYQNASKIDSLDLRLTIYGFLDCLTFSMDVTEIDSGCKKIYAPRPTGHTLRKGAVIHLHG